MVPPAVWRMRLAGKSLPGIAGTKETEGRAKFGVAVGRATSGSRLFCKTPPSGVTVDFLHRQLV